MSLFQKSTCPDFPPSGFNTPNTPFLPATEDPNDRKTPKVSKQERLAKCPAHSHTESRALSLSLSLSAVLDPAPGPVTARSPQTRPEEPPDTVYSQQRRLQTENAGIQCADPEFRAPEGGQVRLRSRLVFQNSRPGTSSLGGDVPCLPSGAAAAGRGAPLRSRVLPARPRTLTLARRVGRGAAVWCGVGAPHTGQASPGGSSWARICKN